MCKIVLLALPFSWRKDVAKRSFSYHLKSITFWFWGFSVWTTVQHRNFEFPQRCSVSLVKCPFICETRSLSSQNEKEACPRQICTTLCCCWSGRLAEVYVVCGEGWEDFLFPSKNFISARDQAAGTNEIGGASSLWIAREAPQNCFFELLHCLNVGASAFFSPQNIFCYICYFLNFGASASGLGHFPKRQRGNTMWPDSDRDYHLPGSC